MKLVNVSGAVILRQNKETKLNEILLIRRSPDDHWPLFWEFPRGKCERNENITKCLKREVKEEVGIDITPLHYIGKFSYVNKLQNKKSTQYNYLCTTEPDPKVRLSSEHCEYRWVSSMGEVQLMVTNIEMITIISKCLNVNEKIVQYLNIPNQNEE